MEGGIVGLGNSEIRSQISVDAKVEEIGWSKWLDPTSESHHRVPALVE